MTRPRVVFMGTPDFAVPSLRAVARRCDVVAVMTQPDRPRGRGRRIAPSEVAQVADELGIKVWKPETMKSATLMAEFKDLSPDLFAVVAFGAILNADWLKLPRLGAINLHGSLLPDYRGASPVQRALWDGRCGTGVTTIWMDQGIDTGDCILQQWVPVEPEDTADLLAARLALCGAPLLAESLMLAAAGTAPRFEQPREGTYAKKLTKRDGLIDWAADAVTVVNHQRAVTPWPGAMTGWDGRRLLVQKCRPHDLLPAQAAPGTVMSLNAHGIRVACGQGSLELLRVKPEGRFEMDANEWARGTRVTPGERMAWNEEDVS